MSRLEPLQPAYNFSFAPESICLLQGSVDLEWRDKIYSGNANVLLQFLPSPRVILHAKLQGATEASAFRFCFDESGDRSLSFNGQKIEGFRAKCKAYDDILELNWMPRFEPVALSDMHSKTSVAATFHLFNFPDFRGGQHQKAAPAGCALLVLESEEWRSSLQELPDGATREAWETLNNPPNPAPWTGWQPHVTDPGGKRPVFGCGPGQDARFGRIVEVLGALRTLCGRPAPSGASRQSPGWPGQTA